MEIVTYFKIKWIIIQLKNRAGMRERLNHDYIHVNNSLVGNVMKNNIQDIQQIISSFLSE